ncbi:hypothetical protein, partial [Pseudomonas savastanoi]|uniref:hypothetical protein n=1 Tax=Pseudomonas savastanoi TaxID=29438 RepID=UPI001C7E29E4
HKPTIIPLYYQLTTQGLKKRHRQRLQNRNTMKNAMKELKPDQEARSLGAKAADSCRSRMANLSTSPSRATSASSSAAYDGPA